MQHILDAKNKMLGRIAGEVAHILQGKHSPSYQPNAVITDTVLVKNASLMSVSGGKEVKKTYYRHTGYMGHLRETSYEQEFKKSPMEVLRKAVFNMLPKNFIRQDRLNRLIIEK
jgi:large subunit ribosomal protein L13